MKKKLLYFALSIALLILIYVIIQRTSPLAIFSSDDMGNDKFRVTVLEKTPYYEIVQKDNLYFCYFYDKSHRVIKEEGPMAKPPKVLQVEDKVFQLSFFAGAGLSTQWGYYYHVESGIFSHIFHSIFDQCNGLVAYADGQKVIVQNIFDINKYYKEIDAFSGEFSITAEPFVDVRFSNACNVISITYLSGADYQKITEVFPLN